MLSIHSRVAGFSFKYSIILGFQLLCVYINLFGFLIVFINIDIFQIDFVYFFVSIKVLLYLYKNSSNFSFIFNLTAILFLVVIIKPNIKKNPLNYIAIVFAFFFGNEYLFVLVLPTIS